MQIAGKPNGLQALLVVGGSALLGALYVTYISAEPFPPALVRAVPAVHNTFQVLGSRVKPGGAENAIVDATAKLVAQTMN